MGRLRRAPKSGQQHAAREAGAERGRGAVRFSGTPRPGERPHAQSLPLFGEPAVRKTTRMLQRGHQRAAEVPARERHLGVLEAFELRRVRLLRRSLRARRPLGLITVTGPADTSGSAGAGSVSAIFVEGGPAAAEGSASTGCDRQPRSCRAAVAPATPTAKARHTVAATPSVRRPPGSPTPAQMRLPLRAWPARGRSRARGRYRAGAGRFGRYQAARASDSRQTFRNRRGTPSGKQAQARGRSAGSGQVEGDAFIFQLSERAAPFNENVLSACMTKTYACVKRRRSKS